MTVSTSTNTIAFTGSGSTGPFNFGSTFSITAATHLTVTKWATATPETITELVYNTDYTVNAALTTITLTDALAGTHKIRITRETPVTQDTDLEDYQATPLSTIESMIDNTVRMVQDNVGVSDRSLQLSGATTLTLPLTIVGDPADGDTVSYNSADEVLEWVPIGDVSTLTTDVATLQSEMNTAQGDIDTLEGTSASLSGKLTNITTIAAGSNGQVATTDGSGNITWTTVGGASDVSTLQAHFVEANNTVGSSLILKEGTNNGTNKVTLKAPDSLSGDPVFILPSADGTSGQYLQTNGSGTMSFTTPANTSTSATGSFTGTLTVTGSSGAASKLVLSEDTANGTEVINLSAPSSLASTYTMTLPTSAGTSGQFLKTDGSGNLSYGYPTEITQANSSDPGYISMYEQTTNGTSYTGFKAPASLAGNVLYTLPSADGTSGQVLSTNGSTTLSWATASGGGSSEITSASASAGTTMDFFEDTDNGTNKITIAAPASISANIALTLPNRLLTTSDVVKLTTGSGKEVYVPINFNTYNRSDGNWTSLGTGTATAAASTGWDVSSHTGYEYLMLRIKGWNTSTTLEPVFRLSIDAGATGLATNYYYWNRQGMSSGNINGLSTGNGLATSVSIWPATQHINSGIFESNSYTDIVVRGMNTASAYPRFRICCEMTSAYMTYAPNAPRDLSATTWGTRSTANTYNGLHIAASTGTLSFTWELFGSNAV